MRLSKLVDHSCGQDPEILGLSCDSRQVKKGDLFFAIPGLALDGRRFIEEALYKGAHAILTTDASLQNHCSVPIISVQDIRAKIPQIAAKFYANPAKKIVMVTGTNGKSSTVSIYQQLLCILGVKAASIGTLGVQSEMSLPFEDNFYGLTTPDPITLHKILSLLGEHHFDHVAIEATSIGLDQHRLSDIVVQSAAFTNFNQDHLDYHQNMDDYFAAKIRLFTEILPPQKTAILNADCPSFQPLKRICEQRNQTVFSFGQYENTNLRLIHCYPHLEGQDIEIKYQGENHKVHLPLLGSFQAYNLLTALSLVLDAGYAISDLLSAIPELRAIPGRLEQVEKAPIFVDYSHKPAALQSAIESLRPHTQGKIILVFGCGGNRDRLKRPIMGKIAEKHADIVIVTDDNPRHEDPIQIRQEILKACPKALEIGDRKQAIQEGMTRLQDGDILIVAGKGNETGQIIGDTILPFNDTDIIKEFLGRVSL